MHKTITILPGDGVGPEVIEQGLKILRRIEKKYNHTFNLKYGLIGASAIEKTGSPLPGETLSLCRNSDAVLFGAIGDPKYDNDPSLKVRPEQGLLKLRKSLDLFANLRPVFVFPSLINASVLKPEVIRNTDFIVVRELTGGIYFGEKKRGGNKASDVSQYSKREVERVAKIAFEIALKQNRRVASVDKANVLETSRLWRETVNEVAKNYPTVLLTHMFVDNAAMQIIKRPSEFDVILTENMFGDILTDEASVIAGSLGILPSVSIGTRLSLYEPIHGSYHKAAGKNTANPIGTILSVEMMLKYSFNLEKEWRSIWNAVNKTLKDGWRTKDIADEKTDKKKILRTSQMGDKICAELK